MAAEAIATIPVDGGRIAYRRLGSGRPLIVLNGLAATSADWDPSFIDRLASGNEIILLDNRGIGASTDDGAPFDIAKLAGDTARVIEALEFERASVLGWSMGGFIAQTLAFNDPARVRKLILLSTDPGGAAAELASPRILGQLTDTSGTPHEQARRLLFVLFPSDLAESIYREFGDMVAAARAKLRRIVVNEFQWATAKTPVQRIFDTNIDVGKGIQAVMVPPPSGSAPAFEGACGAAET